jgi:Undecaprenyl-phosphate galactose phosphotransferase WbaP
MPITLVEKEEVAFSTHIEQIEEGYVVGSIWSRQVACAMVLAIADAAGIGMSVAVAAVFRNSVVFHLGRYASQAVTLRWQNAIVWSWIWIVLLLFLAVEGLYTQRRSLWNEIGHLTKAVGLGAVAILATVALAQLGSRVSRFAIITTAVALVVVLPFVRYSVKWALGRVGLWRKRILILGSGEAAKLAIAGLSNDPILGYAVAGVLDTEILAGEEGLGISADNTVKIVGRISEAKEKMLETGSKDILIAMPDCPEEELIALISRLQPHCDSIYVVPHLWGLPMMNLHIDGFLRERVMMLKLSNNLAKPWNSWLKRGLDLILSTAIGLLVFPLCVVIALAIKLDSNGPAIFVQERIGYHGKNFRCLKFRTMHEGGDARLLDYLSKNIAAADEWRRYAKLRGFDPRLTRLGRLLRKWSLDELPQLINVLRGDMSLIGPRPYLPHERSRIGTNLSTILAARPGITGFWQVNGRNHVTLDNRVQLEAWYVRNWTVWLDCIVLIKTVRTVLFPWHDSPA